MDSLATILIILGVSIVVIMGGLLVLLLVVKKRMKTVEAPRQGARLTASPPAAQPSRLLDIIRERYAKGEITREQYEQLKRDLS